VQLPILAGFARGSSTLPRPSVSPSDLTTVRPAPQRYAPQTLLKSQRFTVEKRVFMRAGRPAWEREYVVHPGSVVILPLQGGHRVVMNRQVRPAVEVELLELPAGTLEANEDPADTARRELREETGYIAGRIEPMLEFYPSPGFITERMRVFIAGDLKEGEQDLDDGEQIKVEIVSLDDIRRKLLDGEFRDGKTIAVLTTYLLQLDAGRRT